MKVIKCLSEFIEDELDASKDYIEKALKYKEDHPVVADLWYALSLDEMKHADLQHDEVVKLIQEERAKKGEPPAEMMFLYEYLHKKHIECATKIKIMQTTYKS